MRKIYVDPSKIWDFFQQHKDELLKNMIPIAEDKADPFETVIYITNVQGYMCLAVYMDDEPIYNESFQTSLDAKEGAEYFYYSFLSNETAEDEDDEEDEEDDEVDTEEMEMREHEIHTAFMEFLEAIVDPIDLMALSYDEASVEELKQDVLEYLGDYGLMVWNPRLVVDDDGQGTHVVNYPYRRASGRNF